MYNYEYYEYDYGNQASSGLAFFKFLNIISFALAIAGVILLCFIFMKSKKAKNNSINDNNIGENNKIIAEKKFFYILLTIFTGFIFCILKICNLGWMSLLLFLPIIIYLFLFNLANILNACIKNKRKIDHIRFWMINFFFLLSVLTFVDFSDSSNIQILKFVPSSISCSISVISIFITFILFIISIITYARLFSRLSKLKK